MTITVELWHVLLVAIWLTVVVITVWILRKPETLDAFGWPSSSPDDAGWLLVTWVVGMFLSLCALLVHAWGWL